MKTAYVLVLAVCGLVHCNEEWLKNVQTGLEGLEEKLEARLKESEEIITSLKNTVKAISSQSMLQQFYTEQRVRSDGSSGLKVVRIRRDGTKNYHTETHNGYSVAAIHDHSNNIRTVGMGEFVGVLNGVEFRTRHNDYRLYQPSKTSKDYHAVDPIEFPKVPKSVLDKGNDIDAQIVEMREYFKAWRDQDPTHRDYTKYFKSLLCYLEGAWTTSGKQIDEPFSSDRHFIDAKTWQELQNKVRFSEYTGGKSRQENLALLPTSITGFKNETIPEFAQWNYRILCHPTKKLLPTNRLRPVEDLSSRMMTGRGKHKHLHSRAARFQIIDDDPAKIVERPKTGRRLIDELMEEIPGKDNYKAQITEEGLDSAIYDEDEKTKKNTGFYHKWYKVVSRDAMGTNFIRRGFSDENLYVASTTQSKIAGMNLKLCKWRTCRYLASKVSYAVPLEIIYLTPLASWNPYNLVHHGKRTKPYIAVADRRWGSCKDDNRELNGTDSKAYYRTPSKFFVSSSIGRDSADTTHAWDTCVLDGKGEKHRVRASGVRILMPNIDSVGVLRQRYPIMPIHGEGSSVWKELNALRDIVMDSNLKHMYWDTKEQIATEVEITMGKSQLGETPHTHVVELSKHEVSQLMSGMEMIKRTSTAAGHDHRLKIRYNTNTKRFYARSCEVRGEWKWQCADRHIREFAPIETTDNNV